MKPRDEFVSPAHYCEGRSIEPLDVIEDWQLPHHLACAVKYIARAGRKSGQSEADDLRKAIAYLARWIGRIESK